MNPIEQSILDRQLYEEAKRRELLAPEVTFEQCQASINAARQQRLLDERYEAEMTELKKHPFYSIFNLCCRDPHSGIYPCQRQQGGGLCPRQEFRRGLGLFRELRNADNALKKIHREQAHTALLECQELMQEILNKENSVYNDEVGYVVQYFDRLEACIAKCRAILER